MRVAADEWCGHPVHDRIGPVDVDLSGPFPRLPDVPAVPERLSTSFRMWLFDHTAYFPGDERPCIGRCQVSRSVVQQGVWEAAETVAALACLDASPDGVLVDVGAQLGWYSLAAASRGMEVVAIDASAERLELLRDSAVASGVASSIHLSRQLLGPWTAPAEPASWPRVALLKADVEGAEPDVVRVFWSLILAGRVDALLLEVSPCFREGYDRLLYDLAWAGYRIARVPGKNLPDDYSADPLGWLDAHALAGVDASEVVRGWSQENVLCWRAP